MNLKNNGKDIMYMSEEEFDDYLIEEYEKMPSDSEIIKSSKKTLAELIVEINEYQDKLTFLAYKYGLSFKNRADFILKLCKQKQDIKELMPLLSCFICRQDYLFDIKNKKVSIKKEGRIAEYLLLKEDVDNFERCIYEIGLNTEKYNEIIKKVKENTGNSTEKISISDKKVLIKLYKQYIKGKNKWKSLTDYENTCIEENIEQIHNIAMRTAERQKLYPVIIFQFFTRYKLKISKETEWLNINNFMNYKKYTIDKDNGKNFEMYYNYIALFLDLVENFESKCDAGLCAHAFERTSNLAEWMLRNLASENVFYHTMDSFIENIYGSIFYGESIFWTKNKFKDRDYSDFKVIDDDGNNPEQYFSEIIEEELMNNQVVGYLNEYVKGKTQAAKFIKDSTQKFLEANNCELENTEDEDYAFMIFERVIQQKADEVVMQKVIEVLK